MSLLRGLRVILVRGIVGVTCVLLGAHGSAACGSMLIVVLCLAGMMMFERGSICSRLQSALESLLRSIGTEGVVCIQGGIVGVGTRSSTGTLCNCDIR